MSIEAAILAFIDDVRDEYYADYECTSDDTIELEATDLIPLPFTPAELNQTYIKVCA